MPNQHIGRYRLLRRLASGGMGEIYLAESSGAANFSKQVAIKCILPHLAKNNDFVQKFIDEANLMVQLHHGNIVPVIELFENEGLLYLVMEYVPGRDLRTVLRTVKKQQLFMPEALVLWIIQRLCEALGYAHKKRDNSGTSLGIIHRDISPSNIMLGAAGEVKLLDFGIAKARSRVHQSISGTLQGKFVYMSPEQADGRPLDHRSDLFSLGLLLYELLTHVRPFDGDEETTVLRNARECEIAPPSHQRAVLTADLDSLVMKALQKAPDARYQDAFAFSHDIAHYLSEQNLKPSSATLAAFLEALYPDGVVDDTIHEIQSIDDALLQQINALTPSIQPFDRATITNDNTHTLLPNSKSNLAKPFERNHQHTSGAVTQRSLDAKPRPTSAFRVALMGLLILTFTGFVVFQRNNPSQAASQIEIVNDVPEPTSDAKVLGAVSRGTQKAEAVGIFEFDFGKLDPESVKITVDNVEHQPKQPLPLNRTYVICATAHRYEMLCKREVLSNLQQPIIFVLTPRPTLTPKVIGTSNSYSITVNEVEETQFPLLLNLNETYRICARDETDPERLVCTRLSASRGHHQPTLAFAARAKKTNLKAKTGKQRVGVGRRKSELSSIPVADVYIDGRQIGTTPFSVRERHFGRTLTFKAKGYVATEFKLPRSPKSKYRVHLKRPGYLTVRAAPPASQILVDKRVVGTGYLVRLPLVPGTRQIEAQYFGPQGERRTWGPRSIQIAPGEEIRLPKIVLKHVAGAK